MGVDRLFKAPPKTEADFLEVLRGCGEAEVKHRDIDGYTVLMMMARSNDWPEAAAAVLKRGCDVNATDKNGHTALHHAGSENHRETARVLLEHGADRTLKNSYNRTAAGQARHYHFNDLAAYTTRARRSPSSRSPAATRATGSARSCATRSARTSRSSSSSSSATSTTSRCGSTDSTRRDVAW